MKDCHVITMTRDGIDRTYRCDSYFDVVELRESMERRGYTVAVGHWTYIEDETAVPFLA